VHFSFIKLLQDLLHKDLRL